VSRFGFVKEFRGAFGVKRLCEVPGLSRSSYYTWRSAAPARSGRAERDTELTERIRDIHKADPAMGEPRITAELRE
jgi:hypothetical protein